VFQTSRTAALYLVQNWCFQMLLHVLSGYDQSSACRNECHFHPFQTLKMGAVCFLTMRATKPISTWYHHPKTKSLLCQRKPEVIHISAHKLWLNVKVRWVALLLHIQEVPHSDLSPRTTSLGRSFVMVFHLY